MDELEQLRQRRMEEIMAQGIQQQQDEAKVRQQINQVETIIKKIFTKEALERYGNVKSAHPETALRVVAVIGQAIQSGKIQSIDDSQLREILQKVTSKREIKIRLK